MSRKGGSHISIDSIIVIELEKMFDGLAKNILFEEKKKLNIKGPTQEQEFELLLDGLENVCTRAAGEGLAIEFCSRIRKHHDGVILRRGVA